jgi:hypothetical protein
MELAVVPFEWIGAGKESPSLNPFPAAELLPLSRVDPVVLNQLAPRKYFKNPCEE